MTTASELFQEERSAVNLRQIFHRQPTAASIGILVVVLAVFAIVNGTKFFDPFNLSLITQQVMVVGILGVAQTLVILTAGIDLSVGAIMVLSSTVMARLAVFSGVPVGLALVIGILAGGLCGVANGLFVVRFKLPPFIATLGSLNIFIALNLWYSKSETVRGADIATEASLLQWLGRSFNVGGTQITYGTVFMVLLFVVVWFGLKRTVWGRHVYATGDAPEASRLSGIQTNRVLISVYGVAGLICGIAGWALIGRVGSASPLTGVNANLDSITAVVIGGTSLFGGRGSIYGTLVGALIVGIFRNGLALAGVDVLWQELFLGVLILVAVGLDQWIRKVAV